ncbi:hypothetical protein E4U39_004000 [Claviceps sp. Clav50 group G5]|nr:hypothetical protein E4U39_004000 [Claviceps sp. Clav50 group G5]
MGRRAEAMVALWKPGATGYGEDGVHERNMTSSRALYGYSRCLWLESGALAQSAHETGHRYAPTDIQSRFSAREVPRRPSLSKVSKGRKSGWDRKELI